MKLPWSQGPTAPYLNAKRFRVFYRRRDWSGRTSGEQEWKLGAIEMVKTSEDACRREVARMGRRQNCMAETMRVVEVSREATVQTGQSVKTVSDSEYERLKQETREKTEYERKELLREKGIIIPS